MLVASGRANAEDKSTQQSSAVIRSEETVFTVNAIDNATTTFKARITINNSNGDDRAKIYIPYDKLSKVNYVKGILYDATGKKVKHLKNNDIKDVSAVSSVSLFDDNRVKYADLVHITYPYTVEFEYQITSKNMMFYPTWAPLDGENLSVENASLRVEMPKGMKLRYHESNVPDKVKLAHTSTHDVYQWQVQNLLPVRIEPYGPGLKNMVPIVRTAPVAFEIDGYQGNMESWESYGQFMHKLNQGRDVLPAETTQMLKTKVAGAKTPQEKIQIVYDYLQSKTRYVSIQLGIGGWQPFEASFVDTKGYGDCKALTNYTQAMLKVVGIDSYQALIRAGDDETDILTEFPSSQFNHVVLYVPTDKEGIWLECTSQEVAAGYAGSHTGGRHALLITPEGGKLIKTPDYSAKDNVQQRTASVKLDEKGNGKASVLTYYTGLQQESRNGILHHYKPEDQKKWIYQQTKIPSFEITSFSLTEKKESLPAITEKLELDLRQSATISGKRMFLTANLMNKWTSAPEPLESRKTEVIRAMAFLDIDNITYELPAGYALEYKPHDVAVKTEFGEYKSSVKVDGQKVTYVRSLEMSKGTYSKELYPKYLEFLNQIIKNDAQQVVFVKNIP
ncbi:DUF3857 domain-containing protein [Pontibacter sp. H249]|uniref:DUF3857 domain-containing protein n=1 Tax=Pontibacter sp. H249 TaxID=3133420 RepID=UPI0030C2DDEE